MERLVAAIEAATTAAGFARKRVTIHPLISSLWIEADDGSDFFLHLTEGDSFRQNGGDK
jgi:hypothetical protein